MVNYLKECPNTYIMDFTSINNLPVLDLGERVGGTQYIDFIK